MDPQEPEIDLLKQTVDARRVQGVHGRTEREVARLERERVEHQPKPDRRGQENGGMKSAKGEIETRMRSGQPFAGRQPAGRQEQERSEDQVVGVERADTGTAHSERGSNPRASM